MKKYNCPVIILSNFSLEQCYSGAILKNQDIKKQLDARFLQVKVTGKIDIAPFYPIAHVATQWDIQNNVVRRVGQVFCHEDDTEPVVSTSNEYIYPTLDHISKADKSRLYKFIRQHFDFEVKDHPFSDSRVTSFFNSHEFIRSKILEDWEKNNFHKQKSNFVLLNDMDESQDEELSQESPYSKRLRENRRQSLTRQDAFMIPYISPNTNVKTISDHLKSPPQSSLSPSP